MTKVSSKNIAETIYELTKGKTGLELERVLSQVKNYLVEKRLLNRAPDILKKLTAIINKAEGIVEAKITSSKKLDAHKLQAIEGLLSDRYKAKKVLAFEKEDKGMLGGVKIEVGDEVIDMTYRNKIAQLQNFLIKN